MPTTTCIPKDRRITANRRCAPRYRFFRHSTHDPKNYYGFANYDFSDWIPISLPTDRPQVQRHAERPQHDARAQLQREMEATIATLNATDANGGPGDYRHAVRPAPRNRIHNKARDNDDDVLINQTELTWKVETGAIKHTVLTGLELAREELDRTSYNFDADPITAGVQAPTATTPLLSPDPFTGLSYTKTPNQNNL